MTQHQLVEADFQGFNLPIIHYLDDVWISSGDIGQALDYEEPKDAIRKIYERNQEELEDYSVTDKLSATDGKKYETRLFNEEGVMLIAMLSHQPKARAFRRWAVQVLKAYRHGRLADLNETIGRLREQKEALQTKYIAVLEQHPGRLPGRGQVGWTVTRIHTLHQQGRDVTEIAKETGQPEDMVSIVIAGFVEGTR